MEQKEKMAVEIAYAYIIQFILYKTLVDNKFDNYEKEYKKRNKEIYECLKKKDYGKILGIIDGISQNISQNIYRPFKKEQEYINNTLLDLFHKPKNYLHDVSPWLDIFIFIKKYDFANTRNEIFGYIYENYLKELYEETQKGQYFTDPAVVNFMLEQVGYTKENIKKRLGNNPEDNYISLIDPSCGSGTFLYSAVDQIINAVPNGSEETSKKIEELINNNIFGLDIAEFPLYLAEMSIVMRMLPLIINEKYNNPVDKKIKVFKTNDSIAEFQDTAIKNTASDMEVAFAKSRGQMAMFSEKLKLGYTSYVRDEDDLKEMKRSLEDQKFPRRRFDFVIGNPPYISYNECSKQNLLSFKEEKIKLNDVYGVNLHSVPSHRKKYSPKPNLYAFFIALGIALLKTGGRLCYIIPQTILTAGDLDVLRYHLAKFTTIEKIITFSGKMFIGRGLKQNKPVATSSLIFVVKRVPPDLTRNQVEIIHYKNANNSVEACLENILAGKRINKKKILQNKLFQNVSNWNFIKQDKEFLDFYEYYKNNTDDISIYYDHATAEYNFKSRFYFDIGYNIDERQLTNNIDKDKNNYKYPKIIKNYYTIKEFKGYYPNIRGGNSKPRIDLLKNNQGYNLLDSDYKIIWSYINFNKFYFTKELLIWARNQICGVGSKNKIELLYLFSILNSSITLKFLKSNLRNENEKDYLVSIASIKEFIRVPKITEDNQFIKDEIIEKTEEMLDLEDVVLSDLVDFSGLMVQKFDKIGVEGNDLVLVNQDKKYKCKIKKDKVLVEKTAKSKLVNDKLFNEKINLADLKSVPAIDFDKQKQIKDYIDDLVFALYFNVPIKKVGINLAEEIKKKCEGNKFYKVIDKSL